MTKPARPSVPMLSILLMVSVMILCVTKLRANEHTERYVFENFEQEGVIAPSYYGGDVRVQLYHDFGFLQRMRLSSAYFVNPEAADRADVDLFIPIMDFSDDDLNKVIRLVGEGRAGFSVVDPEVGIYRILDTEFTLTEEALDGGEFGIVVGRDLEDIFDKRLERWSVISWGTELSMPVDVLVTGATRE